MDQFRRAVEASDIAAMTAALAEDVVFQSPIVFREYAGRDTVGVILAAAMSVFQEFRYVGELHGGGQTALVFKARVSGKDIEGIDLGEVDETGKLRRLTVFVRPFTAALALKEAMAARLAGLDPRKA